MEDGTEEVAVEFTLKDGVFTQLGYRTLQYKGVNYLSEEAGSGVKQIASGFEALLAYLEGKPVSAVNDLYQPAAIVGDADAFAGATVRTPKVISAIWDALNRHVYRVE